MLVVLATMRKRRATCRNESKYGAEFAIATSSTLCGLPRFGQADQVSRRATQRSDRLWDNAVRPAPQCLRRCIIALQIRAHRAVGHGRQCSRATRIKPQARWPGFSCLADPASKHEDAPLNQVTLRVVWIQGDRNVRIFQSRFRLILVGQNPGQRGMRMELSRSSPRAVRASGSASPRPSANGRPPTTMSSR